MRLSSVYLYEKIKEKYEILKKGNLSGNDGYLRPFCVVELTEMTGRKKIDSAVGMYM